MDLDGERRKLILLIESDSYQSFKLVKLASLLTNLLSD